MKTQQKLITAIIIGAGSRGMGYAKFSHAHPDRLKIVAVAEPRDWYRNQMAQEYNIHQEFIFSDWKDVANRNKFADAVIICTQDSMHVEPAVAFSELGYAILLEKPMATNSADCIRIVDAVKRNDNIFAVAHVMRYTNYTQKLKEILDSGIIGELVSMQHLEPVGYWHQAHSFVRGNWRNEKESSPMLLAKSCHDLDWIRYIMGSACELVSSFGSLKHFKKSEKPPEAGEAIRCVSCDFESDCPYSAKKIYLTRIENNNTGWPVNVLTPNPDFESVIQALENGPYGLCVYECDNDVVDHQIVNLWFRGDKSAVFTMTAFNKADHRKTRIFGTRGEIYGDGNKIEIFDFLTDKTSVIDTTASDSSILGGHGGGDYGLMDRFVSAVSQNNPDLILSGPNESLETHLMVFSAEKSRLEKRIIDINI